MLFLRKVEKNPPTVIGHKMQGERKVFPWLETFITRKLREIKIGIFILLLLKLLSKI
jgi:hypothetical protein